MKYIALMALALNYTGPVFANGECLESINDEGLRVSSCQIKGRETVSTYFLGSENFFKQLTYENGLIVRSEYFESGGALTTRDDFEHLDDGSYYKTKYLYDFEFPRSKVRLVKVGDYELKLEEFGYHSRTRELLSIDFFEGSKVIRRDIIKNDEYSFHYSFKYAKERVVGFDSFIGVTKIGDYYQDRVSILPNNPRDIRVKIAIIDSGFDHQHELIRDAIYLNEADPVDGIDNDQDGFIDNYLGTYFNEYGDMSFLAGYNNNSSYNTTAGKYFPIPFETINLNSAGIIDSHGTHVASLALRETQNTVLFAFAGDYGNHLYLDKISKKLNREQVDFVNMSFSFPHFSTGELPAKTLHRLEALIVNNPKTVFFVAAGNNGNKLKIGRFSCLYPACYTYQNVVTIGATADSEWRDDNKYEMAKFSNYSEQFVSLFAPGLKVDGALIGDMKIKYTGTSMASPVAMNIAIKLKEEFPHVSALEIKNAMELTAIKNNAIISKFGVLSYVGARDYLLTHY